MISDAGVSASFERASEDDYRELKRRVVSAGLLEREPRYYARKVAATLALYAVVPLLLVLSHSIWLVVVAGVFGAFAFTQLGLLSHDLGHKQFSAGRFTLPLGLLFGPVLLGFSRAWWLDKHNRHHSHPNQVGLDPDVSIGAVSFTQEQAKSKTGVLRLLNRYQAFLFFPALMLEGLHLRLESVRYLHAEKTRHYKKELALMALSTAAWGWFLFTTLGVGHALLFIAVNQSLYGLYLGSIFAPNHKGMPILERDTRLDFFRRQVLTARNVKASLFRDFWYGGLNYQIEHHLFPNLPRNKLGEAQRVVRAYCAERDVPYYETGALRSYREVLSHLHEASAPLREIFEY